MSDVSAVSMQCVCSAHDVSSVCAVSSVSSAVSNVSAVSAVSSVSSAVSNVSAVSSVSAVYVRQAPFRTHYQLKHKTSRRHKQFRIL